MFIKLKCYLLSKLGTALRPYLETQVEEVALNTIISKARFFVDKKNVI